MLLESIRVSLTHIATRYFGVSLKDIMSLRYMRSFHKKMNWDHPETFYEKIIWLCLYSDTSLWTILSDKYMVRKYISDNCPEVNIAVLYGVFNSQKDIDYDKLPNSFVLKTNNGCATNILVRDKHSLDVKSANKKLRKWLNYPYGKLTGQPHYKRIPPKIIAEEFLVDNANPETPLIDYKFFCFNGKPSYCMAMSERVFNTHSLKVCMYDLGWNVISNFFEDYIEVAEVEKPALLNEMIEIARKLSTGFPFVRVDLYQINNKVYFGELTFTPGFHYRMKHEWMKKFGDLIIIQGKNSTY